MLFLELAGATAAPGGIRSAHSAAGHGLPKRRARHGRTGRASRRGGARAAMERRRAFFPEYLYDPGLLFDDNGRVYVVHGQHTLYVTELAADAKSVKGAPVKIWDKGVDDSRNSGKSAGMEGSHVYKINGIYYITCPAGGTEGWQMCLRSDSIYGPYEQRVIMQDDSSYPPNGLHQGGMVQLKNGVWWFIIMQDRGPIGRVPHLLPVQWKDGRPILGAEGKNVVTYREPDVGKKHKKE